MLCRTVEITKIFQNYKGLYALHIGNEFINNCGTSTMPVQTITENRLLEHTTKVTRRKYVHDIENAARNNEQLAVGLEGLSHIVGLRW